VDISLRVWQVTILAMFSNFKKILAARILTVDFVVCTPAVKKKKSGQVSTCRIGPFPCKRNTQTERESESIEEERVKVRSRGRGNTLLLWGREINFVRRFPGFTH
jgi:hypothetical protein